MTNSREKILKNIRASLHRGELTKAEQEKLAHRMQQHPRGILPERANLPHEALIILFIEQAKNAGAQIKKLHSQSDAASFENVTTAFCGVAETGTIVMLSSKENPTASNFLPEKHVVLLAQKKIVAYYEDAWDLIREQGPTPRTVNFITGPSRTGDIEQNVQIGIHGPKELLILIY